MSLPDDVDALKACVGVLQQRLRDAELDDSLPGSTPSAAGGEAEAQPKKFEKLGEKPPPEVADKYVAELEEDERTPEEIARVKVLRCNIIPS